MKLIKKIFLILMTYIYSYNLGFSDFSKEQIYGTVGGTGTIIDSAGGEGLDLLDGILRYLKNSVFDLLALLVIAVFIYIGGKLVVARGKPDEFKSAMIQFIYVIIGIFVVSAAWAVVKVVSGLNF